ncbi:MAG: DUF6633 family protein [Bacteroides sp.]
MTPSQLVEAWSGTVAQIRAQQDLMTIANNPNIPTIADVSRAFGNETAIKIIANHLQSLCNFGDTEVNPEQFLDTALLIATEYFYLNLSELCLFFRRCKLGQYGQIVWGSKLNIQQVMSALYQFRRDRVEAISKREQEERKKEPKIPMATRMVFLHRGLEGTRKLNQQAKTDYSAFRKLFPFLPEDKQPEEYWEALKADEKNVGIKLCEFNMNKQ